MPLDPGLVGRSFPLTRPYLVGAEKISEFRVAIGDHPERRGSATPLGSSVAADSEAAAEHRHTVAPPTFAIVVIAAAQDAVLFDPDLGLDFSRVVHRDQRFVHHRPIRAGDVLSTTVYIDGIRMLAGNEVLTLRTEISDAVGSAVCTAVGTLVARAAA